MTDRQKLVSLLDDAFEKEYTKRGLITAFHTADYLISNGVTFATDKNVGRWIPVSGRLPDHFGVFIVAIREPFKERVGKDCADFDPFEKTWLPSMCWDKGYEVTHWMELPEPPKEVE